MALPPPRRIPVSSYRLQLGPDLTFSGAAALVPYLAELGIGELYASPILAAAPGSTHGYDICDHGRLSPELGGDEGFAALTAALRAHDLGLLLDFVPNHMAAHPSANLWWRSVLESGPSSPFARAFDIDWDPVKPELKGKVLLPILGDQYGVTLDAGALQLEHHPAGIHLRYGDLDLPLNPRQLRPLLEHGLDRLQAALGADDPDLTEFQSVLFHLEHLPPYTETDPRLVEERRREKEVAQERLVALLARAPRIRSHVEESLRRFNGTPGEPASYDCLHRLLEAQPYRLASWRTAVHEINYRRFFDVNGLAGIRMEEPAVFAAAHALVGRLLREGAVTGIRLDHVDGLCDPKQYLRDLAGLTEGPPVWTLVEKILSPGERLDDEWLVHGTTGYEVLNSLNALFVDSAKERAFRAAYTRFTGDRSRFADVAYASKKIISTTSMASELNVLAQALNRISESHRRWRDFTLDSLREALREMIACFPVYRTYVRGSSWSRWDEDMVDHAIAEALRRNPALEPTIFGFIRQILLPAAAPELTPAELAPRVSLAMKFQQYSGPVQAKGVEDTAFYRYAPLLSLTEVGGDPTRFGAPPAQFHAANLDRRRHRPYGMVATATHDTKRGEDVRTRLDALSEMPDRWRALLSRWARSNAGARTPVNGRPAPDRVDEYHFYQALLGAWPAAPSDASYSEFVERIRAYMLKALREAKLHTSWMNPDGDYERAVLRFVDRVLTGPQAAGFMRWFEPFARQVARYGALTSLAQLALKLTVPGVPDFYQGTELWDLSLVDPDNRRPVDFARRAALLRECRTLLDASSAEGVHRLFDRWEDGRVKLYLTLAGLRLRRRNPGLFLDGEYLPLAVTGERREHLVGLVRRTGDAAVLVLAPRLVAGLMGDAETWPVGEAAWGDTAVLVPEDLAGLGFRNVLTGDLLADAEPGRLRAAAALATIPLGLFAAERTPVS